MSWVTFGQGGEALAKVFALLIDSYLLQGENKYYKFCPAFEGEEIDCLI